MPTLKAQIILIKLAAHLQGSTLAKEEVMSREDTQEISFISEDASKEGVL